MEYLNFFVQKIICIFEIYLVFDFYNSFFDVKKIFDKRCYRVGIILFFGLIVSQVNSYDSTIINFIGIPSIYLALGIVGFVRNMYKKIVCCTISVLIMFGTEFAFMVLLSITSTDILESSMIHKSSFMMITIIMKLITFILFQIFKQFSSTSTTKIDKNIFFIYMLVPFASLGIMVSMMYCGINFNENDYERQSMIIFFVLFLVGNIFTFYGFSKHYNLIEESNIKEKEILEQKLKLESYERLENVNCKYASLLHDMNQHIEKINDLVNNSKVDEIKEEVETLLEDCEHIPLIKYSSNSVVNTLLSNYRNQAEKKKIHFEVSVETCFNIEYVDEMDIIAMLGNLLANTFEAVERSQVKNIFIKMYMQNEGKDSIIKIENSYNGVIFTDKDRIVSTKEDKVNHGIGLGSIRRVAEKYNGSLQCDWTDRMFRSVLILCNI